LGNVCKRKYDNNRKTDFNTIETQIQICYSRIDNHSREHILTHLTTIYMFCYEQKEYMYIYKRCNQNPLIDETQTKQWQEKDKRINNDPQNMHTILKIE
jgi:hypothetical protein